MKKASELKENEKFWFSTIRESTPGKGIFYGFYSRAPILITVLENKALTYTRRIQIIDTSGKIDYLFVDTGAEVPFFDSEEEAREYLLSEIQNMDDKIEHEYEQNMARISKKKKS